MRSSSPDSLCLPEQQSAPAKSAWGRFFLSGRPLDRPEPTDEHTRPWYQVLWLTGVDYFSTLGYQPGIALLAAGILSVPATVVLVLVTLFGAVPVYAAVAGRSYAGQGSVALLENLFSGWKSKIFVLVLLGFAGTDFVITMTLSAADAARHAIANPWLHPYLGHAHVATTLTFLLLLAGVFLLGFREAISMAAAVAIPYILLNAFVLTWSLRLIYLQPGLFSHWYLDLHSFGDWTAIFVASSLVFPRLALGLSGFETGVSVMPLVSSDSRDSGEKAAAKKEAGKPQGKISATRKLLLAAAVIMSVLLLMSSLVATVLIPESAYRAGGPADGRAIAYLAHRLLGTTFGSLYDLSTILVLWFAGASAMTGLLSLIPRYLPRFGMAPRWVAYRRPLVLLLLAIDVVITLIFRANVEAQGSAYATGVLVLMFSAAVAVALVFWREKRRNQAGKLLRSGYFWIVSAVFAYTLIANVIERPAGVIIAGIFILLLIATSAVSRYYRATEMRVADVRFVDDESARLWKSIAGKKMNLVPHHANDPVYRKNLLRKIEENFKVEGPVAFLHVNLLDNRSEFVSSLRVRVQAEGKNSVIEVWGAVAIANSIAYLSELLDPESIVLGLTRRNLMQQSLDYALWGEGEIGLTVYSILVRYWEFMKRDSNLPRILLMSE
ncbi:MAG TPA: hypothetical protein VGG46_02740 [Terriglobales bacterium]